MRTIFLFRYLIFSMCLIAICNYSLSFASNTYRLSNTSINRIDSCPCIDSFYSSVLEGATVEDAYKNGYKRFHFDFFENKGGCLDSFFIEGWYQKASLNDDPKNIPLDMSIAVNNTSFTTPYHFRDIQLAIHSRRHKFLDIQSLFDDATANDHSFNHKTCDYKIYLSPYQDLANNLITIKAQLYYKCNIDNTVTNYTTTGKTITLNPCPPNKPQG